MQDTMAGNKNAGKVMRKNTPREHIIPNEKAAHDTFACVFQHASFFGGIKPEYA